MCKTNGHRWPQHHTLCETCCTPSPTCSWKYDFTPVEGWEAYKVKLTTTKKNITETYKVKTCPLYEKNER